jgi:hypothetical protein
VPHIESSALSGAASTWIGAEAPGSTEKAPFIQVGTQEQRKAPRYAAFWSDTRYGFHPRALFDVAPGDTIAASLEISGGYWDVSIVDLTSGANKSFVTRDEARAAFEDAQWLQEDETDLRTNSPLPYPQLTPTRFVSFAVNGSAPQSDSLSPRWMWLPRDQSFGPKRTGDSFTVRRIRLSGDAEQLLLLAISYDAAVGAFQSELIRWNASTPLRRTRTEVKRVVRATRVFISRLQAVHWPPRAKSLAWKLIDALSQQVIVTPPGALSTPADIDTWRRAWNRHGGIARLAGAISALLQVRS